MKKIILILIISFFITGCYDNIELNNLDIITSIGVHYDNDEYVVSYEILNSQKSTDSITMSSYIETGSGKTISEAFNSASRKIGKKPYFAHLKIVLISDQIEEKKLKELFEYLIRKNDIRDEFYVAITYDEPKKLLSESSKQAPVIGIEAQEMIENSKYDNNISIEEPFEKVYSKVLSKRSDMVFNTFTISGKNIALSGASIYKDYKLIDKLSVHETTLFNLLSNNTKGSLFKKDYDNGFISVNLANPNIKLDIDNNKLKITGSIKGTVVDNTIDLDLKLNKSYEMMNKDFSNLINKEVKKFIEKLQTKKTDILGFTEKYYQKTNKINKHLWEYIDIEVDIEVKINKKGLIFEV